MSTKALRAFIAMYGDSRKGRLQSPLGREALAEVEAIEKAAKDWWDAEFNRGHGMISHEAGATLQRIAENAP